MMSNYVMFLMALYYVENDVETDYVDEMFFRERITEKEYIRIQDLILLLKY